MNPTEIAQLAVTAAVGLAWPAIAGLAILVFRAPISAMISKLESAKGPGVEATFFQDAIVDPSSSEETKDEVASLWKAIAQAKGQSVPVEAQVQLVRKAARRGRPASDEVMKTLSARSYADDVRAALERAGVAREQFIGSGRLIGFRSPGPAVYPQFNIRPLHGVGEGGVLADEKPSAALRKLIETDHEFLQRDGRTLNVLVVSKEQTEIAGVFTCKWQSPDDDDALAQALEKLGVFDYVDEPEDKASVA